MSNKIDTPFNIARRVFYRIYMLAYKAQEHAIKAEEAGDYEHAESAYKAFSVLKRQASEAYVRMRQLDPEEPPPAIIDCDVALEGDLRWVFPDVFAADGKEGYGDWKPDE